MRLFRLCALALATECVHGYLDATPFFMFSTSEYVEASFTFPGASQTNMPDRLLITTSHIQSAPLLTSDIALSLSSCPTDYYILVSQQGVSSSDYVNSPKSSPLLSKALSPSQAPGASIRSSLVVPDVFGSLETSAWIDVLTSKCGVSTIAFPAKDGGIPINDLTPSPRLIMLNLPAPSQEKRAEALAENDAFLSSLIDLLPKQNYTVLYTTSRGADGTVVAQGKAAMEYDMESPILESMHLDLKRDLGIHAGSNGTRNNQTLIDGPLFDRYQFFTPGKFMDSFWLAEFSPQVAVLMQYRHLHGSPGRLPPVVDSLRRHLGSSQSPSYIRGIRQGTRSARSQEAVR